jgi:hypothetical protein
VSWARFDFDSGQNTPAPLSVAAAGRTRVEKGLGYLSIQKKIENSEMNIYLVDKSAENLKSAEEIV